MGTKFSNLAGLSTIPSPLKLVFRDWLLKLRDKRLSDARRPRANVRYVDSGTNNAAAGTSIGSPRLCQDMAALNSFIAGLPADTDIRLRYGSSFRPVAGALHGPVFSAAGQRISFYTGSNADFSKDIPRILGFKAPYGAGGWSDSTARGDAFTNVYSRADSDTVFWVRGGASASVWDYLRTPYARWNTGADLNAKKQALNNCGRRASFQSGGVVYVNPGPGGVAELATIEAAIGTGIGVQMPGGMDDLAIEGVSIEGFFQPGDEDQYYPIQSNAKGNDFHAIINCRVLWSCHHPIGQYTSANGGANAGGIVFMHRCMVGLGVMTVNGATMVVNYNGDGGQEWLRSEMVYIAGALQTDQYATASGYGQAGFSHTQGGSFYQALGIELDPRYVDHPTNRLAGLVTMVNMPPVSGRRNLGQYRGFIVGGRCTGRIPINTGNYEPFGYDYLIINSIDRIESLASNPTRCLTNKPQRGMRINSPIDVDLTASGTGDIALCNLNGVGGSPVHDFDLIHSPISVRCSANFKLDFTDGLATKTQTCSAHNTAFSVMAAAGKAGYLNLPNANAASSLDGGGYNGCLFYGCTFADSAGYASGWSAGGNTGVLDHVPDVLEAIGPGVVLPDAIRPEYDINWDPRSSYDVGAVAGSVARSAPPLRMGVTI